MKESKDNFRIYHFHPLTKWKSLIKLHEQLVRLKANVVLDLEDSVQDYGNPQNTFFLKNKARQGLKELADLGYLNNHNLWVRINGFDSKYFEDDRETLDELFNQGVSLNLFIPKVSVERVDCLLEFLRYFNKISSRQIETILTVEDSKATHYLEKILTEIKEIPNLKLGFGLFDWLLSEGIFPFWEPDDQRVWDLVEHIMQSLKKHQVKEFLHSPSVYLNDKDLLLSIKQMLLSLSDDSLCCSMSSLSLKQSEILSIPVSPQKMKCKEINYTGEHGKKIALDVIEEFENNRISNRSFSVGAREKFITPHEYEAAVKFLNQQS